jgi:hypothetical protein
MASSPWSDGAARCALVALLVALSACVVVPVPEYATTELGRAELAGRLDEIVRPGEPIEDLLLRLGEPDAVSLDGREIVYRWQRVWAWFLALLPVGAGPAPAPAILPVAGPLETEPRWTPLTVFSPSSFRGEPIELVARGSWTVAGRPFPIEALVVITPSGIHLKTPESFGPAPADLSLRFAAMTDARLERGLLGIGASLVLEMHGGFVHELQILERGGASSAEETEHAFRIVAAHRRDPALVPAR